MSLTSKIENYSQKIVEIIILNPNELMELYAEKREISFLQSQENDLIELNIQLEKEANESSQDKVLIEGETRNVLKHFELFEEPFEQIETGIKKMNISLDIKKNWLKLSLIESLSQVSSECEIEKNKKAKKPRKKRKETRKEIKEQVKKELDEWKKELDEIQKYKLQVE